MKKTLKRILSVLLTVIMVLGAAPLAGIADTELFSVKAAAEEILVGGAVELGSYPQSQVTDKDTLRALNTLTLNWISYEYYYFDGYTVKTEDLMHYADVYYNGDLYRAVKITKHRLSRTDILTFLDQADPYTNGYELKTVYWFKYEPLRWQILDPETGLMVCETIIDSQPYSNTVYAYGTDPVFGVEYDSSETSYLGYWNDFEHQNIANDYETSSIRAWLNDDFYNVAFTADERAVIAETTLDNSAISEKYSCYDGNETQDKVFLLSYEDAADTQHGFNYDYERMARGSEYAKSQGLFVEETGSSIWSLRTPNAGSKYTTCVSITGKIEYVNVDYTCIGVRPAICAPEALESHVCDFWEFSHLSQEHPHYSVYRCDCGKEKLTFDEGPLDTCEICNPPHNHSFTLSHYQDEHPHYAVWKCNCGAEKITTATQKVKTCEICYPPATPHQHDYTSVKYAVTHPHYATYKCSCGEEKTSEEDTGFFENCYDCNVSHVCNFTLSYYQNEHPHYAVYKCICGNRQTSDETQLNDGCEECYPPHACNFATLSHYETEHPHYAVYKCDCGAESTVETETATVDGCETCYPPHVCNFNTFSHYQEEHPHFAIYKCACGAEAGWTASTADGCESCYPSHTHTFVLSYYQSKHPHYSVFKCECGKEVIAKQYTTEDLTCETCIAQHVCNFRTFAYYQDEHPHYTVLKCKCGAEKTSTNQNKIQDCEECYPPATPHQHEYEFVRYAVTHPHYATYKCSCGETKSVEEETDFFENCYDCNATHVCNYELDYYQKAHPHYAVYRCFCHKWYTTEETQTVEDCDECCFGPDGNSHKPHTIRVEATCTVNGMEYTVCVSCGETLGEITVIPAAHTWGEWYVTLEPTKDVDGIEERVCSVCSAQEERAIPKLSQTITDEYSGIELVVPNGTYDDEIELEITEQFDGASFQFVTTLDNVTNAFVFDITTKVNGESVQPSQAVTIRIPLPTGYDPTCTFVYHINSETGKVENMKARYEDGYIIFETTHFSEFSVVETEKPKITSIAVTKSNAKYTYNCGEEKLDTKGIIVTATYSDGSTKVIDNKMVSFTGFDTSTRGVKTITAHYAGCETTFNIKVQFTFWQLIVYILTLGLITVK